MKGHIKEKSKVLMVCILFSLVWNIVWNTIPVTASVTDNVTTSLRQLLGARDSQVVSTYEQSTTNAKINYLEDEIEQLESTVDMLHTVIEENGIGGTP